LSKLVFTERAWKHYLFWYETDKRRFNKLNGLINACLRAPHDGIGKPEPLLGEYSGFWSRRIDDEHRLVYRMKDDSLEIIQCRFHYRKT
jgi:toxin YoeB